MSWLVDPCDWYRRPGLRGMLLVGHENYLEDGDWVRYPDTSPRRARSRQRLPRLTDAKLRSLVWGWTSQYGEPSRPRHRSGLGLLSSARRRASLSPRSGGSSVMSSREKVGLLGYLLPVDAHRSELTSSRTGRHGPPPVLVDVEGSLRASSASRCSRSASGCRGVRSPFAVVRTGRPSPVRSQQAAGSHITMSIKVSPWMRGGFQVTIRFRWPDRTVYRDRRVLDVPTPAGALQVGRAARAGDSLQRVNPTPRKCTRGRPSRPSRRSSTTKWSPVYPVAAGNKHTTIREKKTHLKVDLLPFFGSTPLDEIDRMQIDQFVAEMAEKTVGKDPEKKDEPQRCPRRSQVDQREADQTWSRCLGRSWSSVVESDALASVPKFPEHQGQRRDLRLR